MVIVVLYMINILTKRKYIIINVYLGANDVGMIHQSTVGVGIRLVIYIYALVIYKTRLTNANSFLQW